MRPDFDISCCFPPYLFLHGVAQPNGAAAVLPDRIELQLRDRPFHGKTVKHSGHSAPTVDSGADQHTDLVQQTCRQKSGVDMPAAHNGHALYAELLRKDFTGPGQVDFRFAAGNPGDVLCVQIGKVLLTYLLAGENQQWALTLQHLPQQCALCIRNDLVPGGSGLFGKALPPEGSDGLAVKYAGGLPAPAPP